MNPEELPKSVQSVQFKGFQLAADLSRLHGAHQARLHEATIMYGGRILESLTSLTLGRVGLSYNANMFSNLKQLEAYGLADYKALSYAHGLRRMSNAVRHAQSYADMDKEKQAIACLDRFLRWFWLSHEEDFQGETLKSLSQLIPVAVDPDLSRYLDMCETSQGAVELASEVIAQGERLFEQYGGGSTTLAVLVERLLNDERYDLVESVLEITEAVYGDDLRLKQLRGLMYRRQNRIDDAAAVIEPLFKQYRNDIEVIGISAAIHKQRWLDDRSDIQSLRRAYKRYRDGWKQSSSTYLGVNAATAALFLGQHTEVEENAMEVLTCLAERRRDLIKHGRNLSLWDHLSVVEVQLLSRNFDRAVEEFTACLKRRDATIGVLNTARRQLTEISRQLDVEGPWVTAPD